MSRRNNYITGRDRKILQFVNRYRAATEELLQLANVAPVDKHASLVRVLRRLVRRGLLQRVSYAPDRFYWVLTRRGCRSLGVPDRPPRPLTEQSLPVVLAIAWYCVRTGLTRLTDRELRDRFPELWKPGLPSSAYYLTETSRGLVLGMFLVDRGASGRRIKGKIRRVISQRQSLPAFAALIAARRFRVTVLTGLPAQQLAIRRHLQRPSLWRVELEVFLVPELGTLLTLR